MDIDPKEITDRFLKNLKGKVKHATSIRVGKTEKGQIFMIVFRQRDNGLDIPGVFAVDNPRCLLDFAQECVALLGKMVK